MLSRLIELAEVGVFWLLSWVNTDTLYTTCGTWRHVVVPRMSVSLMLLVLIPLFLVFLAGIKLLKL